MLALLRKPAHEGLLALVVLVGACSSGGSHQASSVGGRSAPLLGQDGAFTSSAPKTIVNGYAVLGIDARAGNASVTVTRIDDLTLQFNGQSDPIAPGDLLLLIQMQGATINTANEVSYGAVTDLRSAGLYEFVAVERIEFSTIHLRCNLRNSYDALSHVQVIRVPQFSALSVPSGTSITAPPWDGARGGVVSISVAGEATINGTIDVSGLGFRGGGVTKNSLSFAETSYVSSQQTVGGEKGESIAGYVTDYDVLGGRFGRGAPANGGGGGNAHNASGGGGANALNGTTWTGQGVMKASDVGAGAWLLDPGAIANGSKLTTSQGGGRGGYSIAAANALDALVIGPGRAEWGGDLRRESGGLGGHPVSASAGTRVFFGGGGGGADQNNASGGEGGRGGGIAFILASTLSGSGEVLANGKDGGTAPGTSAIDGAGGGGAGGTILVEGQGGGQLKLRALGGRGGSQGNYPVWDKNLASPGGGGGGGFIASNTTGAKTVTGGAPGTTVAVEIAEFPSNGATWGNHGESVALTDPIAICFLSQVGRPCLSNDQCSTGACVDDVCCDPSCSSATDDCTACSLKAGGSADGVCGPVKEGAECSDGLYCNGPESCIAGVCTLGTSTPCPGPDNDDQCAESCNEETDRCDQADPDNSVCDDGVFCNGVDHCQAGLCVAAGKDPCVRDDTNSDCSESCNETTQQCDGADPDGTACDNGQFCDGIETCNLGNCVNQGVPACPGPDNDEQCAESCNEASKTCDLPDPDGVVCGERGACSKGECKQGPGSTCDANGLCASGFCLNRVCCLQESCGAYLCNGQGICWQTCSSSQQCASEHECNSSGECVPSTVPSVDSEEGCACRQGRPADFGVGGGRWMAVLWVVAIAGLLRQRRLH